MKTYKFMVPKVLAFDRLSSERIDIKIEILYLNLAHVGSRAGSGPTLL